MSDRTNKLTFEAYFQKVIHAPVVEPHLKLPTKMSSLGESLMGGGCLQELRPHWVKMLPCWHMVTAETCILNVLFKWKFNFKKKICCFRLLYYPGMQYVLLYSWRFSRYSTPIYWLVHGHMTS